MASGPRKRRSPDGSTPRSESTTSVCGARSAGCAARSRTTAFGHREAARPAPAAGDRGEHRREHPARRVDQRAARVAGPHQPAQRRDRARRSARRRTRPRCAIGCGRARPGRARRRTARPAGSRGSPPAVPTGADGRDRQRRAVAAPARAAPRCRRAGRTRRSCAGSPAAVAADLHDRVALARDHVRVGHDEAGRRDPAAALDPEPARRTEDPHDARAARPGRPRAARIPRVGGGDVGGRPVDRRQRIEARERVEDRARRRQQLVELAQDRRVLESRSQRRRAGRLERDRADDPRDPEPDARRQHRAEQAVDRPQPGQPQDRSRAHADALEARSRARRRRAARRAARTAARTASASRSGSSSGPSRAPTNAPIANPSQRQRADDEPLHVAVEREQRAERDDQPVDRGHALRV